jgi:hypothetical protein
MAAANKTTVASAKERKNVGLRSPHIVRCSDGNDCVFSRGVLWFPNGNDCVFSRRVLWFPDLEASMPSYPATSGASENMVGLEYFDILPAKCRNCRFEAQHQGVRRFLVVRGNYALDAGKLKMCAVKGGLNVAESFPGTTEHQHTSQEVEDSAPKHNW